MAQGVAANTSIPPISSVIQANRADAWVSPVTQMKNAIDVMAGRKGQALDRAVTLQDLVTLGLVTQTQVMSVMKGQG